MFAVLSDQDQVDLDPFADMLDPSHQCETLFEVGTVPTYEGAVTITGYCSCLRVTETSTDSIF